MTKIEKQDRELQALQMKFTRALTKGGVKGFAYIEYNDEIHITHEGYIIKIHFKKLK